MYGSRIWLVPFLCWPVFALANAAATLAAEAHRIGVESQLFVDDELILAKKGMVRKVHPCEKLDEPVMASSEPWEYDGIDQRIYVYGTILRDEPSGLFRMWYNRMQNVMYATSADGIEWRRPLLGLCDMGGSKANNVVFPHFHSPSVVYNPQEPDPEKRYQMLGSSRVCGRGYHAAHSPDGLHWTLYPKNPVLPSSDTCTLAFDAKTGEYLAFHKRMHEHRGERRRLVYLATSRNMQDWSEPKLVLAPDEADDRAVRAEGGRFSQFYNLSVFPYGGQFLGFVTHFRYTGPPKERGPLQSGDDGPVDVQLVHSRDGRTWNRCEDRSPVIPLGPRPYDAGCILGVSNGPAMVGDEMWLYYTAITTTHAGYVPKKRITIALAKWRRDGLVSLSAGQDGGQVETVLLLGTGNRLVVNADAEGGEIAVSVLDEDGDALPGFTQQDCIPIHSNAIAHHVQWKQQNWLPAGRPVRLRFHVKNARLYSYAVAGAQLSG